MRFTLLLSALVILAPLCALGDNHGGNAETDAYNATRRIASPRSGGPNLDAKGKSGAIRLSKNGNFSAKDTLTIRIHSIQEVGLLKVNPGNRGLGNASSLNRSKSSFDAFENQVFAVSEPENVTYPGTTIKAISFELSTTMKKMVDGSMVDIGRVNLTVYLFTQSGNITTDGERSEVFDGTLKFNLAVDGFQFCDGTAECNGVEGVGINVVMAIVGRGGAKPQRAVRTRGGDDQEVFSLGDDAAMRTSKKINVDGVWQNMTRDFPRIETRGAATIVVFRFQKFTNQVLYDPTLDLELEGVDVDADGDGIGDDDGDDEDTDGNGASSAFNFNIAFMLCLAVAKSLF